MTAVEAMRVGAFDYVQKPFDIEEMEFKINKALEYGGGALAAGAGLSGVIEERRWNRRFLPEAPPRASDALAR